MRKHLLVTISSEAHNLYGVQFLCNFFNELVEHRLTLMHIFRQDSTEMDKALSQMWTNPEEDVEGMLTVGGKRALDRTKQLLGRSKMSIDHVKTKTVGERYGKVKDILNEGEKGLYDAIVLGRRASYTMQWVIEKPAAETAQAMIKDSCFTSPLWICPEPGKERKNVLVAVDGSENSFRAVDHVGYILSKHPQHAITLFHAETGSTSDQPAMFSRARKILSQHEVEDQRIKEKSVWNLTIPGAILSEVEQGGYAVVAVGLHGHERSLLKDYNLAGGTTAKLIAKIEKAAVWCCP